MNIFFAKVTLGLVNSPRCANGESLNKLTVTVMHRYHSDKSNSENRSSAYRKAVAYARENFFDEPADSPEYYPVDVEWEIVAERPARTSTSRACA